MNKTILFSFAIFLSVAIPVPVHAWVWVEQYPDKTVLTFGEYDSIHGFLSNAEAGALKCGLDAPSGFKICQITIDEAGFLRKDFQLAYTLSPSSEILYSDVNDGTLQIDGDRLNYRVVSSSQIKAIAKMAPAGACTLAACTFSFDRLGLPL